MPKTNENPYPDWPGFHTPQYTPIPDELFDMWLPHLSGGELKVLLYICRRTFGWKKEADAISLAQIVGGIRRRDGTQLDYGTGLARSTVMQAVAGLEAKGLIQVLRSPTAAQDNEANTYRPRIAGLDRKSTQGGGPWDENQSRAGTKRAPGLGRESALQETRQETTQEEDNGPSLAAVLSAYGGAWGQQQERAARLCTARGWSPAQLAEQLAARREVGLKAKLAGLEGSGGAAG